ncbi:MAG: hypothetical protein ACI8PP_001146 [Candidatus Pseudothioglobus sp.]|jgi:hypothetical protein
MSATISTEMLKEQDQLVLIEQALDENTYTKGPWQALVRRVEQLPRHERQQMQDDLDRVSNKLHKRNGFLQLPASIGFVFELVLLTLVVVFLNHPDLWLRIIAVGALALSLQPSMKVLAGLLLGVRYSYVYLWYFEPRFKQRYGTYLSLPAERRVMFHLAGSVGTPVALLVGFFVLADQPVLAWLSLAGFAATTIMQVGAFIAAWVGVTRVGPFLLTSLTTPATAAKELKALLQQRK